MAKKPLSHPNERWVSSATNKAVSREQAMWDDASAIVSEAFEKRPTAGQMTRAIVKAIKRFAK